MVTAEQLPLTSLRIIRGLTLYKPKYEETDPGYNVSRQGFSMYVLGNKLGRQNDIGMRELQLPALRGKTSMKLFIPH
jgi:hypothetical protein